MKALTTTTPAEAFRAKAADLLIEGAGMTLHELVDEFQRLTTVMDENVKADDTYRRLNEVGELAKRERLIVLGSARSRFGITFEGYDRPSEVGADW